jgi:hypothetical protein
VAAAELAAEGGVVATLNYLVRTGEKPVNETHGPGPGGLMRRTTGTLDRRDVAIRNGRAARAALALDVNGFELVDQRTQVTDFFDPAQIEQIYYPEMAALIAARSGAGRVHIFDHTLRTGDEGDRMARQIREPVKAVHNDYTEWSGPQRVRDLLPEEVDALIARRFAIIQVWRPIADPVAQHPLAIADSRSLAAEDFIPAERRFPHRVGEIYQFEFNPAHAWFYFPRMTRDEALVFKVYDSAKDGRARWGAHTSFDDPASPADAPPRQSIEIRAFAFF